MSRRSARTDAAGHYHSCALPAGVQLSLHPSEMTRDTPWTVTVPRGGLAVLEWVVVHHADGSVVRRRADARPPLRD